LRSRHRASKDSRIRLGSWNVGTLTGKRMELFGALAKRKVDVACFQETKWKGAGTREENGYKLWYSGSKTAKNGVGIVLASRLKEDVVEVKRYSDRIMSVKLVIEEETVNIVSAYAPQAGLGEAEKKNFWDSLDDLVRGCPVDQKLFIGGDLNGHIGSETDGYIGAHGGFGYGTRNEEGTKLLEFATAHDLVVANSMFKKRDEHLITFHSGGHRTQIDYFLIRTSDLNACKDCKVLPGEDCFSTHRLLVLDIVVRRRSHVYESVGKPRILWKNLARGVTETFRETVL
jgi:exonuclease III